MSCFLPSDCYSLNWFKPHGANGLVRCNKEEATQVEVEIRHGAGYRTGHTFDLDLSKDWSIRVYRLTEFTRMLDLMFGFGIGAGKAQVRQALGLST